LGQLVTGNMSDEKVLRSTPYPLQTLSPVIKPDNMTIYKHNQQNAINHYVKKEYDRLLEQAEVITRQLADLERRVLVTEMVENSRYGFKPVHGTVYSLYYRKFKRTYFLSMLGCQDWAAGVPETCSWVADVKKLGDNTWDVVSVDPDHIDKLPPSKENSSYE
jgi:hypothetical protein